MAVGIRSLSVLFWPCFLSVCMCICVQPFSKAGCLQYFPIREMVYIWIWTMMHCSSCSHSNYFSVFKYS